MALRRMARVGCAWRAQCTPTPTAHRNVSFTSQLRRRVASREDANAQEQAPVVSARGTKASKRKQDSSTGAAKLTARHRGDPGHDPNARVRLDFSKKYTGRHSLFRSTVLLRFQKVLKGLSNSDFSLAGIGEDELNRHAALFMDEVDKAFLLAEQNVTRHDKNPLFWSLRDAFIQKDVKGLTQEVQYSFQSFLMRQRFSQRLTERHKQILDLRFPHEWFPATRAMQRKIHLHVGPTNSGKTYNALKALETSKSAVYAGPLRLLATEVYQRLQNKGLPCALITGEEVRLPRDLNRYFHSCTVEMVPLNQRFDVAVIDEIQMIADPERGNAWTSALLGVQADVVHVCGEERAVNLVKSLCATAGDECIVHRYERLSPLETMTHSLGGNFNKLKKGDAIVSFSRVNLHVLKRTIEAKTCRRCAIVYGTMPPEVRVQQAALFNDPDNDYDFIVASDAIGMGLNLEIKRVVLESVAKWDGNQHRLLTHPEIKQIGGRAGRYRTARGASENEAGENAEEKIGLVTTIDQDDLRGVQRAFTAKIDDLKVASIQPPSGVIELFASYFPPNTPLSFILQRLKSAATVGKRFQLTIKATTLEIADLIQDLPMTMADRLVFGFVPVSLRAERSVEVLRALATIVSTNSRGDLLSIPEIPFEFFDLDVKDFGDNPHVYLLKLESLHSAINQYMWLSYRYSGAFRDQALALHARSLVEQKLIDALEHLDFTPDQLQTRRRASRVKAQRRIKQVREIGEDHPDHVQGQPDDPPLSEVLEYDGGYAHEPVPRENEYNQPVPHHYYEGGHSHGRSVGSGA